MAKRVIQSQQIGWTVAESKIQYKQTGVQPKETPNVVYIVLDDMGFAHLGCYGSNISTPNIDRLADEGLRYNNFHTTAVCSATRASLLTGANHHLVGMSAVCDQVTGFPNAQGHVSNEYATLAEILKEFDYATYCVGKWHLATQDAAAGPYDQWPLGRGFDRYYGFLHAETSQFNPPLTRDNSEVEPPKTVAQGYHFTEDAIDNAIDFVFQHEMANPKQPFFLYLALGAMHAPHHAPKEYIDRYKGKFDAGWDVMRQQWFENQKRLGIVPPNTVLTERNEHVEAWDSLSADHKRVYARFMEAYAGMLEHTDDQIGRFLNYLEEIGKLDDTIIVFLSDNGASAEGGAQGRFNFFSGLDVTSRSEEEFRYALEHIDEIGTEYAFNHYPTGWANAGNTPFPWYKMWAHEGGVQDAMIIRYPKGIQSPGGIRSQYHHVSDITPTILDIMGVDKPEVIKGVYQKPFSGISLQYTLSDAAAPDRRTVQYYELVGNRSIYKDGWKAVVNHTFSSSYKDDVWELYHVAEDFSESHNVADQYPEKLRELQDQFLIEAGRNQVLPLQRGAIHANPGSVYRIRGDQIRFPGGEVTFRNVIRPYDLSKPQSRVAGDMATHSVTAEIVRESKEEDGVLACFGDRFGGSVLYIKDNRLKYVYNCNQLAYYQALSDIEVPVGEVRVAYRYERRVGLAAAVSILINDQKVGETYVEKFAPVRGHTCTLKANKYTPVCEEYEVPFEFKGKLKQLTIHQEPSVMDVEAEIAKAFTVD